MTMPRESTYIPRGNAVLNAITTQVFNIDNGSGTTVDEEVLCLPYPIEIMHARMIYHEATDTTGVATANCKIGTTAGGAEIVAATSCEVSKAIGSYTAMTLVATHVAANGTVYVRHTGRAATEAGQYRVQILYRVKNA
jgi:hypothetical protein